MATLGKSRKKTERQTMRMAERQMEEREALAMQIAAE